MTNLEINNLGLSEINIEDQRSVNGGIFGIGYIFIAGVIIGYLDAEAKREEAEIKANNIC